MIRSTGRAERRLWHEVGLALLVKTFALLALYWMFFASPPRVPPAGEHVFGPVEQGIPR